MKIGSRMGNPAVLFLPVKTGEEIEAGDLVMLNSNGYAAKAAPSTSAIAVGQAENYAYAGTTDGDVRVEVRRGVFYFLTDGTVDETSLLKPCYVKDALTVTMTADGAQMAGTVLGLEDGLAIVDTRTAVWPAAAGTEGGQVNDN